MALVAGLAGCGAKIMEEEIQPQLNAGVGITASELVRRLGPPDGGDAAAPEWTDGYTRATRVPIQAYRNGKWVTVNYRTQYDEVRCTITATVKDGVVTHLAAHGAATACRGPARKIAGD